MDLQTNGEDGYEINTQTYVQVDKRVEVKDTQREDKIFLTNKATSLFFSQHLRALVLLGPDLGKF